MWDGPGGDVRARLAALLGQPLAQVGQIRRTDEIPPKVAVIDVAAIITGHNVRYAAQAVRNIYEKYPDLDEKIIQVKFTDSKGRKANRGTPVTDVRGIVQNLETPMKERT